MPSENISPAPGPYPKWADSRNDGAVAVLRALVDFVHNNVLSDDGRGHRLKDREQIGDRAIVFTALLAPDTKPSAGRTATAIGWSPSQFAGFKRRFIAALREAQEEPRR